MDSSRGSKLSLQSDVFDLYLWSALLLRSVEDNLGEFVFICPATGTKVAT